VDEREPDHVQVDKAHGRLERRELWVVQAGEMTPYLQQDYGWEQVQLMGQIRRFRRHLTQNQWESVTTTLWIAGGENLPALSPAQLQTHLRQHWTIENRVFYVRDVSLDEDRLHGRKIGFPLSVVRNLSINLIRRLSFRFIPDARRSLSAQPDFGLSWLFRPAY
jgi:hypothetical protein